jgi:predicted acetyltransferase
MLHLEFPEKRHERMWREIVAEFEAAGEEMYPYALKLALTDYDEYLAKTNDFHNNLNVPERYVQQTTYFLLDEKGEKILGAINIRHRLNDYLLKKGGNIGYGIAPSERRKGYATKMLALALEKCRALGIERALVTCDRDNTASAKTITNNGGVLENELTEDNGNIVQRYWINL